jgi:inosose dehydratase
MPSVYSGGILHEKHGAEYTIAQAVESGKLCQPYGCEAVVFNANPKGENIRKTEAELLFQAKGLDRLGQLLAEHDLQLRVHNHTPEMLDNAREWRSNLERTDARFVALCLDLDWVYQGDQVPLDLLREASHRITEIHVRSSRNKLWQEAYGPGDIDYQAIAQYMDKAGIRPLIAVELAYRPATEITRGLQEDLTRSRQYAEKIFAPGKG